MRFDVVFLSLLLLILVFGCVFYAHKQIALNAYISSLALVFVPSFTWSHGVHLVVRLHMCHFSKYLAKPQYIRNGHIFFAHSLGCFVAPQIKAFKWKSVNSWNSKKNEQKTYQFPQDVMVLLTIYLPRIMEIALTQKSYRRNETQAHKHANIKMNDSHRKNPLKKYKLHK